MFVICVDFEINPFMRVQASRTKYKANNLVY